MALPKLPLKIQSAEKQRVISRQRINQSDKRYRKSWGVVSKTVAKEKERKYRNEIAEGKHRTRARRIRFDKFAEKYLEYARAHKKASAAKRNEVSINVMMPHFKGKLLSTIHPFMVEQYKKKRRDEGRAVSTINNDLKALKNMMVKAVEWGYLSQNPLAGVRLMREDNEKMWVLTAEEEARLLGECDKRPQHQKYLANWWPLRSIQACAWVRSKG